MRVDEIIIDAEFEALLPVTEIVEDQLLEKSILASNGPTDPLVIWGDTKILIDGHRRFKVIGTFGLPFQVVYEPLENREAVKEWMLIRQLSRRNLADKSRPRLIANLYQHMRQTRKDEGRSDGNVAEEIGRAIGATKRTVYRNLMHNRALDRMIPVWQVEAERLGINRKLCNGIAHLTISDQERLSEIVFVENFRGMHVEVVETMIRTALRMQIAPFHNKDFASSNELPEEVELTEIDPDAYRARRSNKKLLNQKILTAKASFETAKQDINELTSRHYLDSDVLKIRLTSALGMIGATLKYLEENIHKRPKISN